jgi:hemoglobin-like flavoprotein
MRGNLSANDAENKTLFGVTYPHVTRNLLPKFPPPGAKLEFVMEKRQQVLLQDSLNRVRPIKERAGVLFYQCLFEQTPELAPMFANTSIERQGGKLMQILEHLVDHLDQWDAITVRAEALGAMHAPLGVQSDHYAAVGTALVTTLSTILGDEFSEEAEQAWEELYTELSLVMERGARRAAESGIQEKRRTNK